MKIVGRISYALVMVILFWFLFDYAKTSMTNQYIDKYANQALESDPINYDFFVSTVPGFRKDHVLFEIENQDFRLTIHEIVTMTQPNENDSSIFFNEFVYIIAHRFNEPFTRGTKLQITTDQTIDEDVIKLEIYMAPFRQITSIYTAVYDDQTIYIPKDFIINEHFRSIEIIDEQSNILLGGDMTPLNFEIKELLLTVYQENQEFSVDQLDVLGINVFKEHTLNEFLDTLWISMGVYGFILVFGTYFIFFFKKKYLGKQKPTDILKNYKGKLKD